MKNEKKIAAGEALRALMAVDEALRGKTNAEIGDMLLEYVWAEERLGSPREMLLSEAIARLRGEHDKEWECRVCHKLRPEAAPCDEHPMQPVVRRASPGGAEGGGRHG